jgi:hypothetical protein
MADKYFRGFWIVSVNGQTLFPAKTRDKSTGISRYQSLSKGSNKKVDGRDTTNITEALKWFMFDGRSLRFGNDDNIDNRYEVNGGHVVSFGMSPETWTQLV